MNCVLCDAKVKRIEKLCSNLKVLGKDFPDTEVYVAYCPECGLVQYDSEAGHIDFLSYYASNACTPMNYGKVFGKKVADEYGQHILDCVADYIDSNSKILEIGGAWGELATFFNEQGFKDYTVVDVSSQCCQYMEKNGIRAICKDASGMCDYIDDNSFDLIICTHTLEHVLDLKGTLLNIQKILKDDGHTYIEVPDAEQYDKHMMPPFYYLNYEHVLHFTRNDFDNIAKAFGWGIESCTDYDKLNEYPSICTVYSMRRQTEDVFYSDEGKRSIAEYIGDSKRQLEKLTDKYTHSREPLILWGIGASTAQLLNGFSGTNVVQLIDANPSRQGLKYAIDSSELRIESPQKVNVGTIVILSHMYGDSILQQIKEMGLSNPVEKLFI